MNDRVTQPPLGVDRLESFLTRALGRRDAKPNTTPMGQDEWALDLTLMNGLGLHVRSTLAYVFEEKPTLEALERWILAKHEGGIAREHVARLNAALAGRLPSEGPPSVATVLDDAALAAFAERGFVVVHDVATTDECEAVAAALWQHVRGGPDDPHSWPSSPMGPSVEVPLVHHPALDATRRSARVRGAFEQLWKRTDLWPVIDQLVLTRPDAAGTRLRWEVDPTPPVSFGLRGLLYLDDTPVERGAFVCVPGFHREVDAWLASLPLHALPHDQDLTSRGLAAAPGGAGDLVIWHQALPYGRAPNTGPTPSLAQYLTLRPTR